jgi:hypothetical protein
VSCERARPVVRAFCGLLWLSTACGAALDGDHDGVRDALDQCPSDRGSSDGAGCPIRSIGDRDHDGVNDYRDSCPDAPAPGRADGCPATPGAAPSEQRKKEAP